MHKTIAYLICLVLVACEHKGTVPTPGDGAKKSARRAAAPVLNSKIISGEFVMLAWADEESGSYVVERDSGEGFEEIARVEREKYYLDIETNGEGSHTYKVARSGENSLVFSNVVQVIFNGKGGEEPVVDGGDGDNGDDLPLEPALPPLITDFNPKSGPPGISVTITGSHLAKVSELRVGGMLAQILSNTETSLVFKVPASAPDGSYSACGPISFTTAGGTVMASDNFWVDFPPPTISSLSSSSGRVGDLIVLTGAFMAPPGRGLSITFGGVAAIYFAGHSGSMEVRVPIGAKSGEVRLTTVFGIAAGPSGFTVLP